MRKLFFPCVCLLLVSPCTADVITVDDDGPADYNTIQEAINEANDGDTVLVSEGHYYENIDFRGKAITVRSLDPNDSNVLQDTIIDANGDGIVVSFHMGEGPNSVINGFTITGGYATHGAGIACGENSSPTISHCNIASNGADRGGGMYCWSSSPEVSYCTISGNSADYGGGMCNVSGSPTVSNCTFTGNSAVGDGGGLYNANGSPTVSNCTFSGNSADYGGGMYNEAFSSPTVSNCTFTGNSADYGGGMCNQYYGSSPTVNNCTFSGNSADYGGGMCNQYYGSSPTVNNCTFSGNSADRGGGMYNECDSPTVTNCTFAGNSAANGIAVGCDSYQQSYPSNLRLTNCILWDGGNEIWNNDNSTITITYSDVQGTWPGQGNIDADPFFVDPGHWEDPCNTPTDHRDDIWIDGDYHLLFTSPCINAGNPKHPHFPNQTDIDGQPRIMGGRIDMGADEFEDEYIIPIPIHNLTQNTNYETIQSAIDDANRLDEIVVPAYTFYENIDFNGKDIILRSTDPTNPEVVAWTVIDGRLGAPWGRMSVVTFDGTESPDCVLSGFTITNGRGNGYRWTLNRYGGGIYGNGTLATIQNNIISENRAHPYEWLGRGFGGGLYDCDGNIKCNIISANKASCDREGATGGGLYGCDGIIENNVISANRAAGVGPGVGGGLSNCNGTIKNNTIFGNLADYGGGLSECNGIIKNCIVWENTADEGAQLYASSTPSYSCIQDWTDGGIGNIPEDPCFVSPGYWDPNGTPDAWWDDFWVEGDYHLLSSSPCINTGDPNYVAGPDESDIDGQPRVWDGRVDMGADEFVPPVEAHLRILPRVISRRARMPRILAWLRLSNGITKEQVDNEQMLVLYPGEIQAVRQYVFPSRRRGPERVSIIAFFNKAELMDTAGDSGRVELEVLGSLNTGQEFFGTDTVRIVGRNFRSVRALPVH